MQATREEMLFRLTELLEWLQIYIKAGNAMNALNTATCMAHIGNTLLGRK